MATNHTSAASTIRKEVVGKPNYVEKALAVRTNSTAAAGAGDRVLLGGGLGREELPRKTRSMLNLAMLSVLNRPHELKMHVSGALTNGVTQRGDPRGVPAGRRSRRRAGGGRCVPGRPRGICRRQGQRSNAPVSAEDAMKRYRMLIGGEWVDAAGGENFESENPYPGAAWALVPRAAPADVEKRGRGGARGLPCAGLAADERERPRRAVAPASPTSSRARPSGWPSIETRDNGKLITEMRAQVRYMPQWFHYFGGLADKLEGRVIPIDKPGMFNFTREEPLGVVAAITPWNSPLLLAAWKLAPALAAGNTAVWKPSEFSSVSALEFGSCSRRRASRRAWSTS